MTDIKFLALLNDYYNAQRYVILHMMWAMDEFERGREHYSWCELLDWCEAKDERDELWKRFKDDYPRAMMLKEGFGND